MSAPAAEKPYALTYIAFGAGDDSTLLYHLSEAGLRGVPRADIALFADTGDEGEHTYAHIWRLAERAEVVPGAIPIHVAAFRPMPSLVGFLAEHIRDGRNTTSQPPLWTLERTDMEQGLLMGGSESITTEGQLPRACTRDLKIRVNHRYLRRLLGVPTFRKGGPRVMCLVGIAADEPERITDNREHWEDLAYPLVDAGIKKTDEARIMAERGWGALPGRSCCVYCLAGETKVLTPSGAKPIRELVGRARVFVPGKQQRHGSFQDVAIHDFGKQPLHEVRLVRRRSRTSVFATAEHRWITMAGKRGNSHSTALTGLTWKKWTTTIDLKPGDRIPTSLPLSVKSSREPVRPSPFGVAHGFVFGDGSVGANDRRPASVVIYDSAPKDRALLPFFSMSHKTRQTVNGGALRIADLPRSWKSLPYLDESRSYLLGWLSGYFAADGHVTKSAGQATLYSSNTEHVQFFKDICSLLGIETSPIRTFCRKGFGVVRPLTSMSLRIADLPESFWLIPSHRKAVESWRKERRDVKRDYWTVLEVVPTDRVENVYCAVVPDREVFVLEEGIVTGNCPYMSDAERAQQKRERPADHERACQADEALRRFPRMRSDLFVHRSRKPLREVVFKDAPDGWKNDCSGRCSS